MIRKIKINPYCIGATVRWANSFLNDTNHRWHPMRMEIVGIEGNDCSVKIVKAVEMGRAPKGEVLSNHPKIWFTPVEDYDTQD